MRVYEIFVVFSSKSVGAVSTTDFLLRTDGKLSASVLFILMKLSLIRCILVSLLTQEIATDRSEQFVLNGV